jgi:hypothetical protein
VPGVSYIFHWCGKKRLGHLDGDELAPRLREHRRQLITTGDPSTSKVNSVSLS